MTESLPILGHSLRNIYHSVFDLITHNSKYLVPLRYTQIARYILLAGLFSSLSNKVLQNQGTSAICRTLQEIIDKR